MEEYQDHSLRGKVFQQLRERILTGQYQEKDELREITIGEELGVSRTPVREALRQLELEGLVEIVPNKGAFVIGISPKDVADIYQIRSLLEGMCTRWATFHITEKQIEELEEIVMLSEFHLKKKEGSQASQVSHLDGRFHQILYEASDSRIMRHVLTDFHRYVQMARTRSVKETDRAEKSIQEHKEILEAVRQKEADRAEKLANAHVLHAMEHLDMKWEKEEETPDQSGR